MTPPLSTPTEHLMTLREAIESKATDFYWRNGEFEVSISWHWDADELAEAWEDEPSEDGEDEGDEE